MPESISAPEQWRSIPGYQGRYEVSDYGRVRSITRTSVNSLGKTMTYRGRALYLGTAKTGHQKVILSDANTPRSYEVHRLVLLAFVGPCPDGMEACHNDGNPQNNHLGNLRWDTKSANTHDTVDHGVHPQSRKTHCVHGHEYTPENTYRCPRGRRCRTCRRDEKQRRRDRLKAERGAA